MFQRILVGWDGSRPARRALDLAVDIARRYQAEICAVSVAHAPAHAETQADLAESVDAARRYLTETLASVRDRADRVGVPLEHVVVEGDHPAEDLLRYAHEHAFDLVVVGHHRGRAGRLRLHGVAEKLVAEGEIPVLSVTEANGT